MIVTLRILAWLALLTAAGVAQAAAGTRDFEELPVARGVMLIDWNGNYSATERDTLRAWLVAVGETMTRVHGELPRERIRVELTAYRPAGGRDAGAVPFARVLRRAPQGVEFFIDPSRPRDEYIADWTAYHEFSHLFIPYPGDADIWFSEGLASYYQNVLQYRAGLLTEAQAWQKLHDGFARGRDDDGDGELTLAELSPRMRERGAFMRVYWTGALYFVEAEAALRDAGAPRLDAILRDFGDCCLEARRRWSGASLVQEFDRIAATDVFSRLYTRYATTRAIPDYMQVLADAGAEVAPGRVRVVERGFLDRREPIDREVVVGE